MKVFHDQYCETKFTFKDLVREKYGHNPMTYTANHVGVKNKTQEMK